MLNNKFNIGDKIYQVRCGDVGIGEIVQMWELPNSEKEVGYSVKGGIGGCFWNPDIGKTVFTKPMDAVKEAAEFVKTHDCILACDMEFVERQDFSGKNYHNTPTTFGVFADGKMYVRENFQFAHIVDYGDVYKAKEALYKIRQEKLLGGEHEVEPTAKLENVYRCNENYASGKWIYASSGYSGVIGNLGNYS